MEKNNQLAKLFSTLSLLTIICAFADTPALASTPVRFKQVQNLLIVPVTVNGAGPFDFIFDTGASSTVIDSELAKQLSLSPIESTSVLTVAGSSTVRRYRLNGLTLGPMSAQSPTVLCAELREIHAINPKLRGVLGQNFLSGFDYILNHRDQRIEFEEDGEFANTLQGRRLSVERDRGRVLINTQPSSPQKQASKLVLDSGSSSVVVFKGATKNSDLEIELDVNGGINASTIVGTQQISTGRLRRLQIGNEKFSGLPVRIVDNRAAADGRPENGLLPTRLFRSIYFNNTQNFVILNPRASGYGWLLLSAVSEPVLGQENGKAAAPSSNVAQRALQYFEKTGKGDLGDYLKSIRPAGISPDQRARLITMIRKEDIISPSAQKQAKLDALRPVLEYHERSTVEVKILRLGLAWAGMLEGAAVVVSEEALDLLTAEELQAVVAHELGHEYFAAEYDAARQSKQYDKVKEVELRCDAISVITMRCLRLKPDLLMSGVSKLTKFNEARGVKNSPNLVSSLDERVSFCQAMIKLIEARSAAAARR